MKQFVKLSKLSKGDQVAVVSPAGDAAGRFPWVYEVGIKRLHTEFGLEPKEYPSTLQVNASQEEKAKDIMEAFSEPANKAVISTLGGFDQVRLLKYLDPTVFKSNPKPFFGYSDNTHLVNYLWNLGIPAFYGGALMIQFGHGYANQQFTTEYLKDALFNSGEYELKQSGAFNDETITWADKANWQNPVKVEENEGWIWDGDINAEGTLWGGCVESMAVKFASGQNIPKTGDLKGCILFLETSEEIPQSWAVSYALMGMGERGWFDQFGAVLFGRPKAWHFDNMMSDAQKTEYKKINDRLSLILLDLTIKRFLLSKIWTLAIQIHKLSYRAGIKRELKRTKEKYTSLIELIGTQ